MRVCMIRESILWVGVGRVQNCIRMRDRAIKGLLFDVFGTVVDWRVGVARDVAAYFGSRQIAVDADAFADAWRGQYQPAMERIRDGSQNVRPPTMGLASTTTCGMPSRRSSRAAASPAAPAPATTTSVLMGTSSA